MLWKWISPWGTIKAESRLNQTHIKSHFYQCFHGTLYCGYTPSFPDGPPTCSPSSSLTFNLFPPEHRLSSLRVRLLVIIIAAVSHLHCRPLFGSAISALLRNSESPEITFFFPVCPAILLSPPFFFLFFSPLYSLLPLSHPVWAPRCVCVCVCVCVSSRVWGLFQENRASFVSLLRCRRTQRGGSMSVCEK